MEIYQAIFRKQLNEYQANDSNKKEMIRDKNKAKVS